MKTVRRQAKDMGHPVIGSLKRGEDYIFYKKGVENMNRNEILKQAIAAYGKDAQTDICIEECSELIKALLKYRRNDRFGQTCNEHELKNIQEEIADVQIMIDQMRLIYGDTTQEEKYKLERLAKRLENLKGNCHE